jgi:hypothetical protein
MKILFIIMAAIVSRVLNAQTEAVFRVSRSEIIQLIPDIDTLLGDEVYHFQIKGIAMKNINRIEFDGGKALETDSDVTIHTFAKPSALQKYVFKVFAVKNDIVVNAFQKNFIIVPKATLIPAPAPSFMSAPGDIVWYNVPPSVRFRYSCKKDSLLIKLQTLLMLVTPASSSKSRIESTISIKITSGGTQQNYHLKDFVISNQLAEELNNLTSGAQVDCSIKCHSFYDPPEDANLGPYIFVVKE